MPLKYWFSILVLRKKFFFSWGLFFFPTCLLGFWMLKQNKTEKKDGMALCVAYVTDGWVVHAPSPTCYRTYKSRSRSNLRIWGSLVARKGSQLAPNPLPFFLVGLVLHLLAFGRSRQFPNNSCLRVLIYPVQPWFFNFWYLQSFYSFFPISPFLSWF